MVATSAGEAVGNARRYTTCRVGQCLMYTRTWLEIGSQNPSAAAAWANAVYKHPGDRSVPTGAPVFWTGGSRGYGHIALAVQGGNNPKIRSTDVQYAGAVSEVPLSWFDAHWPGLHYVGWTESLNGVTIPYLHGEATGSQYDHGDVYVAKLHEGQKDSDSVARLCYRLINHKKMPGSHRPQKVYHNYTQDVLEAVRYWQRNIAKEGTKGPTDGSSMSNPQANQLFGSNYTVHNKK